MCRLQELSERVMDFDVEKLCNATYGERSADRANRRNGYRKRLWETRAGAVNKRLGTPIQGERSARE